MSADARLSKAFASKMAGHLPVCLMLGQSLVLWSLVLQLVQKLRGALVFVHCAWLETVSAYVTTASALVISLLACHSG